MPREVEEAAGYDEVLPADSTEEPADVIPADPPERGFFRTFKDNVAEQKAGRRFPVTYLGGGPFGLKPRTPGDLVLEEEAVVFQIGPVRKQTLFGIPYAVITRTTVDSAKQMRLLTTILAGPLFAYLVKGNDKLLRIDFTDDTATEQYMVYRRGIGSSVPMEAVESKLLQARHDYLAQARAKRGETRAKPGSAAKPADEDVIARIEKLASLRTKGIITEEEFEKKKSELLSRL